MGEFSTGKRKAVSQTLLDCGKILFAALVAADFIKLNLLIKALIIATMALTIALGIAIHPDEDKGD
jgi:hypothetical protein